MTNPLKIESAIATADAIMRATMEDLEAKLLDAPEDLTLNEFFALLADFDKGKFGNVPVTGTMLKLVRELSELFDQPGDAAEYADILILLGGLARRGGVTNVARGLRDKLLEIRQQEFLMQPNGTGNRVKTNVLIPQPRGRRNDRS